MLCNLGLVARAQEDFAAAHACYQESLALHQEMGDQAGAMTAFYNQGYLAHIQGDLETARAIYEKCLAFRREVGNKRDVATLLADLGHLALDQNDHAAARSAYGESLIYSLEAGDERNATYNLLGLAAVAARENKMQRAVRLAAAAEGMRERIDFHWGGVEIRICEQTLAISRNALSEHEFNTLWTEGQQMPLDKAAAYALMDTTQ